MKRLSLVLLVFVCMFSCERDPVQPVQPTPQVDSETETFNNSIKGVWLLKENNEKGMFFISFQPTSATEGKYALCFSTSIMSSGTYKISSKKLQLTNYMGRSCGTLNVSVSSTQLTVTGNVKNYDMQHNENVFEYFTKTNESFSYPIIGYSYEYDGVSVNYGSYVQYATFTSDYMLRVYCQQVNGAHSIFNDYNYYYVYRKKPGQEPFVYTQRCNGDGVVHIYQFTYAHYIEQTEVFP